MERIISVGELLELLRGLPPGLRVATYSDHPDQAGKFEMARIARIRRGSLIDDSREYSLTGFTPEKDRRDFLLFGTTMESEGFRVASLIEALAAFDGDLPIAYDPLGGTLARLFRPIRSAEVTRCAKAVKLFTDSMDLTDYKAEILVPGDEGEKMLVLS
jgi:hypothetical protein